MRFLVLILAVLLCFFINSYVECRVLHVQALTPTDGDNGFWRKKTAYKPRWVQTWQQKIKYMPLWKKVWGPVEVKEWVPLSRPLPLFRQHRY